MSSKTNFDRRMKKITKVWNSIARGKFAKAMIRYDRIKCKRQTELQWYQENMLESLESAFKEAVVAQLSVKFPKYSYLSAEMQINDLLK
jgi:hypothetical protein